MHLDFGRISVQKDRYKLHSGAEAGPEEFMAAPDKEAALVAFKRIVIEGHVLIDDFDHLERADPFSLVLNLRGNVATLTLKKDARTPARLVFDALQRARREFGAEPIPAFRGIMPDNGEQVVVFSLHDALWFADIIHILRDHGGFRTDVTCNAFSLGGPS